MLLSLKDLSDPLREWFAEEATNSRGSVRYGFVATRFCGRLIRFQGRTLDLARTIS